jgi:hypothetical protein
MLVECWTIWSCVQSIQARIQDLSALVVCPAGSYPQLIGHDVMIYSNLTITRKFVLWVLHAGSYTQLIGRDVMIYAVSSGNYLCMEGSYNNGYYWGADPSYAVVGNCNGKNMNQQWRILGERRTSHVCCAQPVPLLEPVAGTHALPSMHPCLASECLFDWVCREPGSLGQQDWCINPVTPAWDA